MIVYDVNSFPLTVCLEWFDFLIGWKTQQLFEGKSSVPVATASYRQDTRKEGLLRSSHFEMQLGA